MSNGTAEGIDLAHASYGSGGNPLVSECSITFDVRLRSNFDDDARVDGRPSDRLSTVADRKPRAERLVPPGTVGGRPARRRSARVENERHEAPYRVYQQRHR